MLVATDAPCYVVTRGAGRAGDRLPRAPWRAGVAAAPAAAVRRGGARGRPHGAWCSRTSSTTPTSVRSSAAPPRSGVDAVLLSPRCADPLYRRSIKVAMGAVFTMPWTRLDDWYDALPELSAPGFTTVALTLADDAVDLEEAVAGRRPGGAGARHRGPRPVAALGGAADRRAVIPMAAGIDSLNVAAATAVACYVTARR